MTKVICQKWEETEKGWGIRPDGYSLHLTLDDCNAYVKEYWTKQRANSTETPNEYSRPSGTPYECEVDDKTFEQVGASKNGIRIGNNNYPGDGGCDDWVQLPRGGQGKIRSINAL